MGSIQVQQAADQASIQPHEGDANDKLERLLDGLEISEGDLTPAEAKVGGGKKPGGEGDHTLHIIPFPSTLISPPIPDVA